MPLHDHHARYEGQSPEFYSRVFETANVGLQDPRNPGYASAASSNLQNLTDAVAAGHKVEPFSFPRRLLASMALRRLQNQ